MWTHVERVLKAVTAVARRPRLLFVSASPTEQVAAAAAAYMRHPRTIDLSAGAATRLPASLTHTVVRCERENQRSRNVTRLLSALTPPSALIFASRESRVDELREFLAAKNVPAEILVNSLSNADRRKNLDRMKTNQVRVWFV
jgi:superfamily II DNA/RNA helicase